MDSTDYVYGTIFVLYVALFSVVGVYACTRKRRSCAHGPEDEKDSKIVTEEKVEEKSETNENKEVGSGAVKRKSKRKKAE